MRTRPLLHSLLVPTLALALLALYGCADGPTVPQDQTVVAVFNVVHDGGGGGHEPPPGGEGCTPGFWKNHLELWVGVSPSDDFDTTFGVDLFDPDITLEQAVNAHGGGVNKLARHGTAALVSALHPDVAYPLTVAEVIAAVQAGDADTLVGFNELTCSID